MYDRFVVVIILVALTTVAESVKCHLGKSGFGLEYLEDTCPHKCVAYHSASKTESAFIYGCAPTPEKIPTFECDTMFEDKGESVKSCCCSTDLCNDEAFREQCSSSILQGISSLTFVSILLVVLALSY